MISYIFNFGQPGPDRTADPLSVGFVFHDDDFAVEEGLFQGAFYFFRIVPKNQNDFVQQRGQGLFSLFQPSELHEGQSPPCYSHPRSN